MTIKTEEIQEKIYIVEKENGKKFKITVPADWKVTFGPAAKGMHTKSSSYKVPLALRFYENADKQRAIFTDVVSFRDSSILVEEEKVRIQEKDGYMECDGIKKKTTFQATVKEWINPDIQSESTPALPQDGEIYDFEEIEKPITIR